MLDSLLLMTEVVRDTISVLRTDQVVDFYQDMMDKQASQFTILISVLCGVFACITFVTLWWNYKGAKQQIAEEGENNKRAFQRLFKTTTSKMEENLKDQFKEEARVVSEKIHHELDDYKKSMSQTIDLQQAELSRVFALHCDSTQSYFNASTWWYAAARLYHLNDNDSFAQISVNSALDSLRQFKDQKITLDDDDYEKLDSIISDVSALPDSFSSQKSETKKLVKEIRAMHKKE